MISWRLKAALALFVFVVSALASDLANGVVFSELTFRKAKAHDYFFANKELYDWHAPQQKRVANITSYGGSPYDFPRTILFLYVFDDAVNFNSNPGTRDDQQVRTERR
jgi:hypothetical protein